MTWPDQVPHAAENMLLHPGRASIGACEAELLESVVVHGGSSSSALVTADGRTRVWVRKGLGGSFDCLSEGALSQRLGRASSEELESNESNRICANHKSQTVQESGVRSCTGFIISS
jgi:hypothetical protein